MTKEEIQSKIIKLEFEIDVLERRLDNGMSNQMKIRWYKRDIRNKQKEIAKLKKQL